MLFLFFSLQNRTAFIKNHSPKGKTKQGSLSLQVYQEAYVLIQMLCIEQSSIIGTWQVTKRQNIVAIRNNPIKSYV